MQRHVRVNALLLALAIPAVASAAAQETHPQDEPRPRTDASTPPSTDMATPTPRAFEELDANGDGSIAKDEAAVDPALTQAFGTLDQDADGKLSPTEYAAYRPAGRNG